MMHSIDIGTFLKRISILKLHIVLIGRYLHTITFDHCIETILKSQIKLILQ